ncbi:hypothetical protein [Bdellovibrio svalbardensis]|uniref:Uncharacterized protein n=1 Tax=Bdellovibrio svalbardensis TaxID=2972972 RepID=A0ABT6DEU3_9BACT|nr:hypothetical protein [Bdellovibrio svalbardensis]MDG0815346.1 hypothetical protein [Bdellovibrio svalbardensis]
MSKNLFAVALFCLHVIPLNSFAASASSTEIDSLVEESRPEAQAAIRAKIQENQRLVLEIAKVSADLDKIKADIAENSYAAKKDLIIAGGTAVATAITSYMLIRKTGRSEMGDQINLMLSMASTLVGSSLTIFNGGKAGYHYIILKLDEKKIPALEATLADLKQQLERQTEELLK